MTEKAALESAFRNWPSLRIAAAEVQKRQALEHAARNLEQPEISIESPTGQFFAPGVSQSFALPAAFSTRKKLLRAETERARRAEISNENELRKAVRLAFLDAQKAAAQAALAARRDSVFEKLADASARLFSGGQIDFLEKKQAAARAALARNDLASSLFELENALADLHFFVGAEPFATVEILSKKSLAPELADDGSANPEIQILEQTLAVKNLEKAAQKASNLPKITLGYLNQAEKATPLGYRFRAAATVPIWRGAIKAADQAAQIDCEKAAAELDFSKKTAAQKALRARAAEARAEAEIAFFETSALADAEAIIAASARLFEGGEKGLAEHLRTLGEAFSTRSDYLDALQKLAEATIEIAFLNGK